MSDYYTVKQTAEKLGLTEQTIRNYLTVGRIKSEKRYYSTVISEEEIKRQLQLRGE